jgi:predicted O-methyltransferase YrrM
MELPGVELLGWCSPEKEEWLTKWIRVHEPKLIVEIGVYAGASLIPMAFESKAYSRCVGIDPWELEACLEGMLDPVSRHWWTSDFTVRASSENQWPEAEAVCRNAIEKLGLTNIELWKGTSDFFKDSFEDESIDLLSIDGNHGPQALIDGKNYLRKVKPGGLIACDDATWNEDKVMHVKAMIDWLLANGCNHLGTVGDCAMLSRLPGE